MTPDGKYLVFIDGVSIKSTKGKLCFYDMEKDKIIKVIEIPDSFGAGNVVFGYEMVKISDEKEKEGKTINAGTKEVKPVKKDKSK